MEHRWSKRFNVNIDVSLYGRDGSVVQCKTHDAGTGGICIDAVPEALIESPLLEVEFEEGGDFRYKKSRNFRFRALVVHSSTKGIGLMFVESKPETLFAWRQVIRRIRHQPSNLAIKTPSTYPKHRTQVATMRPVVGCGLGDVTVK